MDCNVILVTIDTLRRDHMSVYGYERETTPKIGRAFRDGLRFENAQTTAPCTLPAVAQLLTGALRPVNKPRLADRLRDAGWRTAAIASHHHFRRARDGEPRFKYARGFEDFDLQRADQLDRHRMTTRDAGEVTDRALAWLDANASAGRFFLWLHYFDPHDPYQPPADYRLFGKLEPPATAEPSTGRSSR